MVLAVLVLILAVLLFGSARVLGAIGAILGTIALLVGLSLLIVSTGWLTGVSIETAGSVVVLAICVFVGAGKLWADWFEKRHPGVFKSNDKK